MKSIRSSSSPTTPLIITSTAVSTLVLLLLSASTTTVSATDHIVGANRGWNPGFNYTLWANNQTFYVGDLISFRYVKTQYNVFEVNQTGYDNCTTEGAVGNWSSGKDFIHLDEAKRYYFICGNGGCFSGMKVSVVVHPLPSPPGAAAAGGKHQSANSAVTEGFGLTPLIVAASVFWTVVMRFGWI